MIHTDITFSVVSHGHGPLLDAFFADLCAHDSLHGVHVVLTLNKPDEDFDPSPYPQLQFTLIRNPQPKGFGANHNAAFQHCRTAWFAVLNPDLRLSGEEPFTRLLETGKAGYYALVAPSVLAPNGQIEDSVRHNLTPWSLVGRRFLGQKAIVHETDQLAVASKASRHFFWLAGMCLLLRSDAYRDMGGFDERYFLYCEDYDICARIWNRGGLLALDRSARIVHDAQRDSHRSKQHLKWHLEGLAKVWRSRAYWSVVANS